MLDSSEHKKREAFRAAVERAREDGLSLDDMASMITAVSEPHPANGSAPPAEPDDVMYEPGELPEGLIDLPSAAKKYWEEYRVSADAMRQWVRNDRVSKMGRMKAPAPGGGYFVVRESELVEFMKNHGTKVVGPGKSRNKPIRLLKNLSD